MVKTILLIFTLLFIQPAQAALVSSGLTPKTEIPTPPVIRSYPNPVVNELYIDISLNYITEFTEAHVKIINLLGQEMTVPFDFDLNKIDQSFKIELKDIPTGIYMLEIELQSKTDSYKYTKKIKKN